MMDDAEEWLFNMDPESQMECFPSEPKSFHPFKSPCIASREEALEHVKGDDVSPLVPSVKRRKQKKKSNTAPMDAFSLFSYVNGTTIRKMNAHLSHADMNACIEHCWNILPNHLKCVTLSYTSFSLSVYCLYPLNCSRTMSKLPKLKSCTS